MIFFVHAMSRIHNLSLLCGWEGVQTRMTKAHPGAAAFALRERRLVVYAHRLPQAQSRHPTAGCRRITPQLCPRSIPAYSSASGARRQIRPDSLSGNLSAFAGALRHQEENHRSNNGVIMMSGHFKILFVSTLLTSIFERYDYTVAFSMVAVAKILCTESIPCYTRLTPPGGHLCACSVPAPRVKDTEAPRLLSPQPWTQRELDQVTWAGEPCMQLPHTPLCQSPVFPNVLLEGTSLTQHQEKKALITTPSGFCAAIK